MSNRDCSGGQENVQAVMATLQDHHSRMPVVPKKKLLCLFLAFSFKQVNPVFQLQATYTPKLRRIDGGQTEV